MAIKPYLQLIRLPNVFTAGADSLAGWLLVGGSLADWSGWLPLVGASFALYAGGVALNDYFDYATDLEERPKRPLPSGRVSLGLALGLGVVLMVAGFLALFVAGVTWISRSETESGRTTGTMAGLFLQNLAILGLIAAALQHRQFPAPLTDRPIIPLEGLLVLLIVCGVVDLAGAR